MKKVILMAMVIGSALTASATGNGDIGSVGGSPLSLSQTLIANCQVLTKYESSKGLTTMEMGGMKILSSDNGDEGLLTFKYKFGGGKMTVSIGDKYALPKKIGDSELHVGLDAKSSYGGGIMRETPMAIYLVRKSNNELNGKINSPGILQADLFCKTVVQK